MGDFTDEQKKKVPFRKMKYNSSTRLKKLIADSEMVQRLEQRLRREFLKIRSYKKYIHFKMSCSSNYPRNFD